MADAREGTSFITAPSFGTSSTTSHRPSRPLVSYRCLQDNTSNRLSRCTETKSPSWTWDFIGGLHLSGTALSSFSEKEDIFAASSAEFLVILQRRARLIQDKPDVHAPINSFKQAKLKNNEITF